MLITCWDIRIQPLLAEIKPKTLKNTHFLGLSNEGGAFIGRGRLLGVLRYVFYQLPMTSRMALSYFVKYILLYIVDITVKF